MSQCCEWQLARVSWFWNKSCWHAMRSKNLLCKCITTNFNWLQTRRSPAIKLTHTLPGHMFPFLSVRKTSGYMDVSENNGTPKSSIFIGFSIINHHYVWKHPYKSHPLTAGPPPKKRVPAASVEVLEIQAATGRRPCSWARPGIFVAMPSPLGNRWLQVTHLWSSMKILVGPVLLTYKMCAGLFYGKCI